MGFNHAAIDRLLPRHRPRKPLRLEWNVRTTRRARLTRRFEEDFDSAEVIDISLEGALVDVDRDDHPVGHRVTVRLHGVTTRAEIRHRQPSPDHPGKTRYGIRFLADAEFRDTIAAAVATVRGHRAELAAAWNRAN